MLITSKETEVLPSSQRERVLNLSTSAERVRRKTVTEKKRGYKSGVVF